jgi:hypothetical protein
MIISPCKQDIEPRAGSRNHFRGRLCSDTGSTTQPKAPPPNVKPTTLNLGQGHFLFPPQQHRARFYSQSDSPYFRIGRPSSSIRFMLAGLRRARRSVDCCWETRDRFKRSPPCIPKSAHRRWTMAVRPLAPSLADSAVGAGYCRPRGGCSVLRKWKSVRGPEGLPQLEKAKMLAPGHPNRRTIC